MGRVLFGTRIRARFQRGAEPTSADDSYAASRYPLDQLPHLRIRVVLSVGQQIGECSCGKLINIAGPQQ